MSPVPLPFPDPGKPHFLSTEATTLTTGNTRAAQKSNRFLFGLAYINRYSKFYPYRKKLTVLLIN